MVQRRAKIVATIGPSCEDVNILEKMIRTGVDVARINMAHGQREDHKKRIELIREAALRAKKEVAILMDLQGPKIRVASLENPLSLSKGEKWFLGPVSRQKEGGDRFIPTDYERLVEDCRVGTRILFDDGLLETRVLGKKDGLLQVVVVVGGVLKSRKGINLPGCHISASHFTEADREDLLFGIEHGVDYVALSFIRERDDISNIKFLLRQMKKDVPIIAKIERSQAIENIDSILEVADVVMIARGDMGVELGNHLVPSVQKMIINKCNTSHIPVITATQMLESMTGNPTPTRAEASDVANAIWDGTDAVMLSGETAMGKYPLEVIGMMDKIVVEAEKIPKERPFLRDMDLSNSHSSLMVAASVIAEKIRAKKILSITEQGRSSLSVSLFRPLVSILGVTHSLETARRMALFWGVSPFYLPDYDKDNSDFRRDVIRKVVEIDNLNEGDMVVITRGDGGFFSRDSSNSVRIHRIGEDRD